MNKQKLMLFASHMLRSSGGEMINKIAVFALSVLIIQQLGQEGYGQLSLIMSIVFLISIVSDAGINRLIIRDTPVDPSSWSQYISQLIIIKTLVFSLSGLVVVIRGRGSESFFWQIGLSYMLFGYGTNIIEIAKTALRARQHIRQEGILKMTQTLITILPLLAIRFMYQQFGAQELSYAYTISGIASMLQGGYYLYPHAFGWSQRSLISRSLINGSPFLVSAILNYCYSEISLFMISYQLGNQAVGVYAVGYRIMVYACLLIDIVTQVSFKQFSDEYHQKQSYRSMMIVLGGLIILTVLGHIMSILGSHIIILLIYGTAFQQTASLLIGFSFATIIIAINFVYGSLLTIQHHNRDRVIIQAIVACVHIIGTWYGMIYYGLFGAVVGLCLSQFVMMLGYMMLFYRSKSYRTPIHDNTTSATASGDSVITQQYS